MQRILPTGLDHLQQAREEVFKKGDTRLDFNDAMSLKSDIDYLTGLIREQFDDVITYVKNIRPTKIDQYVRV